MTTRTLGSLQNPGSAEAADLLRDGFLFTQPGSFGDQYFKMHDAQAKFRAAYDRLPPDQYRADRRRDAGFPNDRHRRHGRFKFNAAGRTLEEGAHGQHFQTKEYNSVFGDIHRSFEPVSADVITNPILKSSMDKGIELFGAVVGAMVDFDIEVHLFRINPSALRHGNPTPEGIHQDQRSFVQIVFLGRENVAGGVTSVYREDKKTLLAQREMRIPFEAAYLIDERTSHAVSPVTLIDPKADGYRDVLVVTYDLAKPR